MVSERRLRRAGLLVLGVVGPCAAGPCDIYGKHKTPCVAAHSTTRALYDDYRGALYQLKRASDNETVDIKTRRGSPFADSAAQDAFCDHTTCLISSIYDQSGNDNHLTQAPPGGAAKGIEANGHDSLASAIGAPVRVGGKKAYGVFIAPHTGYRNNKATKTAKDDEPQGIYAVLDGTHYSTFCCFDYGNAERNNRDTGAGKMEAIYFGIGGHKGDGEGPWVQADLEDGMFSGSEPKRNSKNKAMGTRFVTAIVKGKADHFAIKGGDAASGKLTTLHDGPRPDHGYKKMRKEGAIVLGIGGDNSERGQGTFYEGAMTAGYPSDEAEAEVQADIVKAKYATTTLNSGPKFAPGQRISMRATTACCNTRYITDTEPGVQKSTIKNELVSKSSGDDLKRSASWIVREGLGFSGCFSFESVKTPGKFLRHTDMYRLVAEHNDNSKIFKESATFCTQAGLDGPASLRSWNYPTRYFRHYDGQLYIAANDGPYVYDAKGLFNQDATYEIETAFA